MFGLSTLTLQLIIVGIVAATSFGSGWKVNEWRHGAHYAAQMEGGRIALDKVATELAKLDVKHQTIYQKVQTNVIEKPIYRECKHDPDTLRLLNDALTNGQQSSDKSKLPRESRGGIRQLFRDDDPETNGSE